MKAACGQHENTNIKKEKRKKVRIHDCSFAFFLHCFDQLLQDFQFFGIDQLKFQYKQYKVFEVSVHIRGSSLLLNLGKVRAIGVRIDTK